MYPITNEVMALFESEQQKVLRITGTDKNGATITITDNNVIEDSFQIDRYSCNGEKLEIGTAVAAQMTLTLENGNGTYDDIAFEGAELFVEVGVADWTQSSPTITYIPCGYFTPDEQPRRLSTIKITALDRMTKFDVVVEATDLTFPTTIAGLVGQVCTLCGVTLAQSISGLVNAGVTVTELPTAQDEITYRNLVQWCAGIMGTNAWLDWNGQLRFSWYNNATGYVSTVDNRYNSDMYEDDLTVSGVEYTNDSGIVIVEGTDDYAIDLTGNAIAGPLVATVLPPLNTALNGFTYRPFTAATVNAPYLWPMDIVTFTDKDGNDHTSALTNVAFGLNGTTALEAKGMTYAINKAAQPKGFTKEQAQLVSQAMEHVEQDIDDSLTQQEIFNRLTNNGAAQGMILANGQLYVNASYINTGELSANRISGGTLTLGGNNNVNGQMQVLDASGNVVGTWNNNGMTINKGTIAGPNITLGGANNANGQIQVLDASGNVNIEIASDGIEINNANNHMTTRGRWQHTSVFTPYFPAGYEGDVAISFYNESSARKRSAYFAPISIGLQYEITNRTMNEAELSLNGIHVAEYEYEGDVGTDTKRFDVDMYNHLMYFSGNAQIDGSMTLGSPLPISSGGTGASDVVAARKNLRATYGKYVTDDTWYDLWSNYLANITDDGHALALLSGDAASVLSNGKITSLIGAVILRGGTNSSRSFRIMAVSEDGHYQYSWKITSATESSRTTGTVYRFTGTAL